MTGATMKSMTCDLPASTPDAVSKYNTIVSLCKESDIYEACSETIETIAILSKRLNSI